MKVIYLEESYHFESIARINHHQNQVGNFSNINHGIEVIWYFDKRQPTILATDHGNGPHRIHVLACVVLNEALDECGFSNLGFISRSS